MPVVHVLGEVMVDVVAHAATAPAVGTDTAASITEHDGGSAANVAAWLAQAGMPVRLIARVGADPAGAAALARLAAAGVGLDVEQDDESSTGRCIVIVTPGGERTMLPDPGANARLSPAVLDLVRWATGDHLHVSGYSLLRPSVRHVAFSAIRLAREQGLTISVDASSAAPLRATGAQEFLAWIRACDVLLANADEACELTGSTDPRHAAAGLARDASLAVVKVGADGVLAASADGREWHVAAPPTTAVDSTGAGDAFAAGFMASWTIDRDPQRALEAGTRLAARAVAVVGARP
jgi:sugar/nucleoside kinase (ribokinase family)